MLVNSPLTRTRPDTASTELRQGNRDPDLTSDGQPPADPDTLGSTGVIPPAERLAAERDERRRQRTLAHESSTATREPRRAQRRKHPGGSASRPVAPTGRPTLRDSASAALIAVVAAGGVFGAILGALSVAGWIIGLLVAGLTVVLSAVFRPDSISKSRIAGGRESRV